MAAHEFNFFLIGLVGAVTLASVFLVIMTYEPGTYTNTAGTATQHVSHDGERYGMTRVATGESVNELGITLTLQLTTKAFASAILTTEEREEQATLDLGDTATIGDVTVTLYETDVDGAGFIFAGMDEACGLAAEQTQLCRGGSACCGGTCVRLPSCGTFACGDRTLDLGRCAG